MEISLGPSRKDYQKWKQLRRYDNREKVGELLFLPLPSSHSLFFSLSPPLHPPFWSNSQIHEIPGKKILLPQINLDEVDTPLQTALSKNGHHVLHQIISFRLHVRKSR
jgi:hypothetical protein